MEALHLAQPEDLTICYEIINAGKQFQKEQGFIQWTDDYPNLDTIKHDIAGQKGYVLKSEGRIAGYLCIDFGGEPAYDHIEGTWHSSVPYAVVHRMAFSRDFQGKGLTASAFPLIEQLCLSKGISYIRIDTDFPNKRMQHILEKQGFSHCGTVMFQGSGKMAYDKLLHSFS